MNFVLVDMGQELIQKVVGPVEFLDAVGGQERREAFLPVVVAAFDFAFGLGCGRETQCDSVEVQCGSQLGQGVRCVGEEKGMIVHIEGQRQAMSLKGARQEIEVGQQGFAVVEAGAGVEAGGVVQEVVQALLVGIVGQPGMGAGVVLPECAQIAGLPAFDGLGPFFVTGVWRQLVFDGPAADAGAGGFKINPAMQFAGGGAVRGRRLGREEFLGQSDGILWPLRAMVATGCGRRPGLLLTLGAGLEVVGV